MNEAEAGTEVVSLILCQKDPAKGNEVSNFRPISCLPLRLKKAALKSKSTVLMDSYRQARNKVNSVNIKLKKQYFSTKISECRGNMKEFWKTINKS